MLAASPAGMPTGLALPGGITVATASPAGAWPRDGFAGGRLMTEAWSGGVPGQFASRGGCRWRGEGPGHLGLACRIAGEAHLRVSGSAVTPPDQGSRATAPGQAVFWILAGRYRLCLTTSC